MYTPIKCLNQFSTDWQLKARITKKYDIRQWSNKNGSGQILNIDIMDRDDTLIQATFFNEAATKYADILAENKVFLFSGGQVKIANKKFTSIKNDYSLTFDQNSEIKEVQED